MAGRQALEAGDNAMDRSDHPDAPLFNPFRLQFCKRAPANPSTRPPLLDSPGLCEHAATKGEAKHGDRGA